MQQKTKQRIVISGASGFIGKALANHFVDKGFEVIGLVRNPEKMEENGVLYVKYSFEQQDVPNVFQESDVFIHCAYSTIPNQQSVNKSVFSAQALLKMAKQKGVKLCVFLSSIAAESNSGSFYAQEKRKIEALFQSKQDIIVRPGLVIGQGGLFYKSYLFIKNWGVLPVFGEGKQTVHYISLNDIVSVIHFLVEQEEAGTFYALNDNSMNHVDFYTQAGHHMKRKIRIIKIPYWFVMMVLHTVGKIIKLPVSIDSIKGLKHIPELDKSILKKSCYTFDIKNLPDILNDFQG